MSESLPSLTFNACLCYSYSLDGLVQLSGWFQKKKELQKHIVKHSIDIDIALKLKCILRFLVIPLVNCIIRVN
jgi:hypothetical protein